MKQETSDFYEPDFSLATENFNKFIQSNNPTFLNLCISHLHDLRIVDADASIQIPIYLNSGFAKINRYLFAQDENDAKDGLHLVELAINLMRTDPPFMGEALLDVGLAFESAYQKFENPIDIDRSMALLKKAIERLPPPFPKRAEALAGLGFAAFQKYIFHQKKEFFDISFNSYLEGIELFDVGSHPWTKCIDGIGVVLIKTAFWTGSIEDCIFGINYIQKAIKHAYSHSDKADFLCSAGYGFMEKFYYSKEAADLDEASVAYREIENILPQNDPRIAGANHNLAVVYHDRFGLSGESSDLVKAICSGEISLKMTAKRSYGLSRCNWKGWRSFQSYVWLGVIAFNLSIMANALLKQI